MRSTATLLVLGLTSALVGCAAASSDGSAATDDALSATVFAPAPGLYVGHTTVRASSCQGITPLQERSWVTAPAAGGYTFFSQMDRSATLFSSTARLYGKTGAAQQAQSIPSGSGANVVIESNLQDFWTSPTAFTRRSFDAIRCEGDGCGALDPAAFGGAPCSVSLETSYALAECAAYPFRAYYGGEVASVWVTGTFTGWAKTPEEGALVMQRGEDGVWALDAALPAPASGEHLYKFVLNGATTWDADPANPVRVDDGQTGENSVLRCR